MPIINQIPKRWNSKTVYDIEQYSGGVAASVK